MSLSSSPVISEQPKWQSVLRQQKLANARRWLKLLEESENKASLVHNDYDNFLRALETSLHSSSTFDLAYDLEQMLFPLVFGYADWDRWLIYLQQTLFLSQQNNREEQEAKLLEQIGGLLFHKGKLENAKQNYKDASKKYKKLNNISSYCRVQAMLASLYDIQGNSDKGILLCNEALKIANEVHDKIAIADIYLNLSNIYRRKRNWELGIKMAENASLLYQEAGNLNLYSKAYLTLVGIWADSGDWEQANLVSKDLVHVLSMAGDVYKLSQLKNNLGIVAFSQGNFNMAEAAWQEALQLHSQIQEPTELAGIYNNLGMVYTHLAEWETAEEMLLKAITAYRRFGDVFNWANSLDNLADLYEAQGQTAEFQHTLQEAIAGLQALKETPHAVELLNYMNQRLTIAGSAPST